MGEVNELQQRVAHLEHTLRERDKADAKAKADALAAANVLADAKATAERADAAAAERETIRRGAHLSALLAKADPKAPVDFAALEKKIPAEGFPTGFNESTLVLLGMPKKDAASDTNTTSMGKLLKGGFGNG